MTTSTSTSTDPVAAARALQPMIRAAAGRTESERRVPQEVIDALIQAGMFHMVLPPSVGGGGGTARSSPRVPSRRLRTRMPRPAGS